MAHSNTGAKMEKPVVCLGIMVADIVGRPMHSLPELGSLVLVDEMSLHTGGCAVSTGSALARLGLPVKLIGKVGADPFGDFLVNELEMRGVDINGVKWDDKVGTSATMAMVAPEGERRFVHYIGANASLTLDDIDFGVIKQASILHIAGSLVMPGIDGEPTAKILKTAKESGVVTFLDTVWDDTGRWNELLGPCLPYLDYFVPSLPEGQAITGEKDPVAVAQALQARGVGVVGLKMGEDGCVVLGPEGEIVQYPSYRVDVVNTTGAGDAYAAGFIAGVWHGWSLEKTARFANAVGALCVIGLDASGGITTVEKTLTFMEKTELRS
jgi:sugar/nucleoside kinase (ribokinase family)